MSTGTLHGISVWMCECCEALWAVSRLEKLYRNPSASLKNVYLFRWGRKIPDKVLYPMMQKARKSSSAQWFSKKIPRHMMDSLNCCCCAGSDWAHCSLRWAAANRNHVFLTPQTSGADWPSGAPEEPLVVCQSDWPRCQAGVKHAKLHMEASIREKTVAVPQSCKPSSPPLSACF